MRNLRLLALIAATFVLSACLPVTSKTPVGSTKSLSADAALAGTWKMKLHQSNDKTPLWAIFVPAKDGSFTILLAGSEMQNGQPDGQWMQLKGRTARLGANNYLNVITVSSDGQPDKSRTTKDSVVLFYRHTGAGSVALYDGDEKKFASAIKARKIAGIVADDGEDTLNASATALDAFFQDKNSAGLFKPYAILTKVN